MIGDIHIKINNERETNILMLDIIDIISNNDIAFVVIMGDTLDNHGKIDMECLCRASDLFDTIITTGKHLFVLIGNHDRKNNRDFMSNRHPFRGWDNQPGITIVNRPFVYDFPISNLGFDSNHVMKFCFVPFVPNGMYMEALKVANVNIDEITTFFSHQEFENCRMNKLSNSKCDVWKIEYPLNISGHDHIFLAVQENLHYLDTPFQTTYTDSPDKGVYLLDLKSAIKIVDGQVIETEKGFQITKKELNIPQKAVWKVHYKDLATIVIDPNIKIRLDIYGPTALVREIMNRPDMKAKFANVAKKYKEESKDENIKSGTISRSKGDFHFYNAYVSKLSKDPRMFGVHLSLFPHSNLQQMQSSIM